jgi:hypothetical protein
MCFFISMQQEKSKVCIKKRMSVVHTSLANLVRVHKIQEWLEAIGIFHFCNVPQILKSFVR